jgi:hypothetical protein
VYANLTYTDEDGNTFAGPAASAAIGSDCIFGTETSDPVLDGCGAEAFAVVSCFPNCDDSITQEPAASWAIAAAMLTLGMLYRSRAGLQDVALDAPPEGQNAEAVLKFFCEGREASCAYV